MLPKHRFAKPALAPGKEGMLWLGGMTADAGLFASFHCPLLAPVKTPAFARNFPQSPQEHNSQASPPGRTAVDSHLLKRISHPNRAGTVRGKRGCRAGRARMQKLLLADSKAKW